MSPERAMIESVTMKPQVQKIPQGVIDTRNMEGLLKKKQTFSEARLKQSSGSLQTARL